MKTKLLILALGLAVTLTGTGFAAKKNDEPSVISAYAGKYTGTVLLAGSGFAYPGTTTGTFRASKKNENGSLTLTSVINASGTSAVLVESYSISKKNLSYLLNLAGTLLPASGSVKVKEKQITYTTFGVVGSTSFVVIGKMTLSKNRLKISQTFSGGSTVFTTTYSLKKKGGKK
jgi:hypothetical protein